MKITIGATRDMATQKEWWQTLRNHGGLTLGGDMNYRLTWGYHDRGRYSTPERWLERWHLEWLHPVSREYERIATFEEGITKEFMSPTTTLLIEALNLHRKTVERSRDEIHAKVAGELAERERQASEKKLGMMEDSMAAFPLKTWMPVSGPMTPEKRRRSEYGG